MKRLTYGDSMAVMVLAAERMGLSPALVSDATAVLEGKAVHIVTQKAIETEACRINTALRCNAAMIAEANDHAEAVKADFGFVHEPSADVGALAP